MVNRFLTKIRSHKTKVKSEKNNKYPEDYVDDFRLVCEKENTLTVQKTYYKHRDLYYLKDGRLYSITAEIYEKGNKEVDDEYETCNHAIKPNCYFKIAELLGLEIDKESYIYLVCMWCENNDCLCPTKMESSAYPKMLPAGWENIFKEADEIFKREWDTEG